jgi:hypothetical protein
MKKTAMRPWIVETWCLPPPAEADCVWRLAEVLQTSRLPDDPRYPVVCCAEACQPWWGEVRPSQRPRPGKPGRVDDAEERNGVCQQLLRCEPWRGGRHVQGTARRPRQDDARGVRALVEDDDPQAQNMRVVQAHLNTPAGASL